MLSIITNFGCDTGCKYCIFRNHPMNEYKTKYDTFNWGKLRDELEKETCNRISVSGGGDPLFDYENTKRWWRELIGMCVVNNVQIDIHTSKLPQGKFETYKFHKYVLHTTIDKFHEYGHEYILLSRVQPLRLVVVVTDDVTIQQVYHLSDICNSFDIQLSFRQFVREDGTISTHLDKELTNGDGWFYIKQDDYNTYFMPDNKIYTTYLGGY